MSHYKIESKKPVGKKVTTLPPKSPKSNQYKRDRIYRCAFRGGRKLGYDQGYTEGFDAGYEKGYAEGSSLGYNNGFFSAIDLKQSDQRISQGVTQKVEGEIVALLQDLIAKGGIAIHIYGEQKHEAKLLFRQLDILIETGPG